MTQLKTLKDLFDMNSEFDAKFRDLLKQEAIKWVKHIDEAVLWHRTDYRKNCKSTGVTSGQLRELQNVFRGQKIVLINFFNLTEEDLK